jgi:hypothetical protein
MSSVKNISGDFKSFRKGLSMSSLAALSLVTACGLFQPPDATPQVSSVEVVQNQVRLQAGNPAITPGTTALKVQFNVPVNQLSVERSLNIYKGTDDLATNPTSFQPLQLTSMCNGRWRVRNPNAQPISFQWDVYNKTEKGVGVAAPNADTLYQSTLGSNTVRVFVGNTLQQTKATNPASCSGNLYNFNWSDARTVQIASVAPLEVWKPHTLAVSTAVKNESGTQEIASPFSSGFITGQGVREGGILTPGGAVVHSDGIRVSAPPEALDRNVNVWIERVDPRSVPALSSEYTSLSGIYRIGSPERVLSKEFFTVDFPLPNNLPDGPGEVVLLSLINDATIYSSAEPEYKLIWSNTYTELNTSQRIASVLHKVLLTEGTAFTLAFRRFSSTQLQSQTLDSSKKAVRVLAQAYPLNITCGTDLNLLSNCQCPAGRNCDQGLLNSINESKLAIENIISEYSAIYNINPSIRNVQFVSINRSDCQGIKGAYKFTEGLIFICLSTTGELLQGDVISLLRHELFHSLQGAFIDLSNGDLRPTRRWVIEGTATAAVSSSASSMNSTSLRNPRVVVNSANDLDLFEAYKFQDFWVFVGRSIGEGLGYLRPIFTTGLNNPVVNVSERISKCILELGKKSSDGKNSIVP